MVQESEPGPPEISTLTRSRAATPAVLLFYAACALILTYPLALDITSRMLGDGDAWLFAWNIWWMDHALSRGLFPFCTDQIHFPNGICAYLHTWNLPVTMTAALVYPGLSLVTLYNLAALLSFVLAGWGMYRFSRRLGLAVPGALLSGLAFSFSPYHYAHALGHLNLISYQWIPFFLASVLEGVREGWKGSRLVRSGLWLVLVALTDWYYLVFCGLGAVLMTLFLRRRAGEESWRGRLAGLLGVFVLALVLVSPLLAGMIWQAAQGLPEESVTQIFSADPIAFLIPGAVSSYESFFRGLYTKWTGVAAETGTFIPWSLLILSFWGWRQVGDNRRWLAVWLPLFFILSLGPYLHFNGRILHSLPLPYLALEQIPGFSIMRAPIRFHLMTLLGLSLLYGAGANRLLQNLRSRKPAYLMGMVLILETLSVPLQTSGQDISRFYGRLRQNPNPGAVIDLHYSARALFYQTVHERQILGNFGMVSRQTAQSDEFLRQTPAIAQLLAENQPLSAANGWPEDLSSLLVGSLPHDATLIGISQISSGGNLSLRSEIPLKVRDAGGSPRVEGHSFQVAVPSRLVLQLDWPAGTSRLPLDLKLNGEPLSEETRAHFQAPASIPGASRAGFTWVLYRRINDSPRGDSPAWRETLRNLGFRWIILPFYGHDSFLREGLGLTPVYEDEWLQAYDLAPGATGS